MKLVLICLLILTSILQLALADEASGTFWGFEGDSSLLTPEHFYNIRYLRFFLKKT